MSRICFAIAVCLVVGLLSWASIWTVYGWRRSIAPDPSVQFDRTAFINDAKLSLLAMRPSPPARMTPEQLDLYPLAPVGRAIVWMLDRHVFPDAWLYGLFYTWGKSLYRDEFLLGMHARTGWWTYFPLAMLFKTPLAVLAAGALLIARWIKQKWRDWRRPNVSWEFMCLWLAIVIYGAMLLRSNLDIGLRHALPVYPFIYILMSGALARWIKSGERGAKWITVSVVILAAIESLASWPNQIAFFNYASGGWRGGMRLLSDSNLDWGQDLPQIARWQQAHPRVRLYLAYFGSVDPHDYNIDYVNVSGGYPFSDLPIDPMKLPGVLAISATYLQGTYNAPDMAKLAAYLKDRPPKQILGRTLYLYDWNPAEFDAFVARSAKP